MARPITADSLSAVQARRIALAAQGFTDARPRGVPDRRSLRRVLTRTGLLQIDSVNVLARAHYLPLFSRLGRYPTTLLDDAAYTSTARRPRELFEYWGHEASLLPVDTHPLFRWRMAQVPGDWHAVVRDRPGFLAAVLADIAEAGPQTASDLAARHDVDRPRRGGPWWDWSDLKLALEYLFWTGQLTTTSRRGFERVYDLTERVLPAPVLNAPTPTREEAHRALLLRAARSCGLGSARDLADYYRLPVRESTRRLAELVDDGTLRQVAVTGWRAPAYLHAEAHLPRRVRARALLAPFDPLVWERARTERLFGFRYRIEIYTPAAQRVHGYYVLPFLLGERLVARVDLKADRQQGVLRVQAAHAEPGAPPDTASELAAELATMAQWLGLDGVAVSPRGDLAAALAAQPPG